MFIACEEDRPVPIQVEFRKPMRLLDPDKALLRAGPEDDDDDDDDDDD